MELSPTPPCFMYSYPDLPKDSECDEDRRDNNHNIGSKGRAGSIGSGKGINGIRLLKLGCWATYTALTKRAWQPLYLELGRQTAGSKAPQQGLQEENEERQGDGRKQNNIAPSTSAR